MAADGVNEGSAIDIQGILTTTGVSITIPYTVTGSSVNLPAFSQTINVPAASTQDGISRDVTFSYPSATYAVGSGNISATLQAVGGTLNLKKLDIQSGVGNDAKGWLLAQFRYSTNSSGASAGFAFRDIAGIPDKNFADANHRMLYLPVSLSNGTTWLNNNLGADYSNTAKAAFNPGKQASSASDFNAYGSLFRWGRFSDGHELFNYTSASAGTPVNTTTISGQATNSAPGNVGYYLFNTGTGNWLTPADFTLWSTVASTNNPCPTGYRVPSLSEWSAAVTALSITNSTTAASSSLALPSAGQRNNSTGGASIGVNAYYYANGNTQNAGFADSYTFLAASRAAGTDNFANSVRCIKDNTPAATIGAINCGSAVQTGNLANGNSASGVSIAVPYSGGNSGLQLGQTVTSTGVTGLTATLAASVISTAGNFTYTISGTPSSSGTASFAISVGGQSCTLTASVTALPSNLTLSAVSPYFISSVYDQDYIPYTTPTTAASLTTPVAADGTNEGTTIDIQGTLSTTGVSISIPYTVTGSSANLPAFSQTITISAASTQDGISRDVTFSYNAASLAVGSGTITATLKAVGGTLNAKKLDIQAGVGNDNLGWLLGQFTYAVNSSGGTATFDFRDIAGIPDKNFADANHRMLYLPVAISNGTTWLNNNLGADYSNTAKAAFNPAQQASSFNDFKAFGSLFQWGRFADGHELINWTSASAATAVNTTIVAGQITSSTPGNTGFVYYGVGNGNWLSSDNYTLWSSVASTNNPCPIGYRVPSLTELNAAFTALNITNYTNAASSALALSASGQRNGNVNSFTLVAPGSQGNYLANGNTTLSNRADVFYLSNTSISASQQNAAWGSSVRCIKDNTAAATIGSLNCGSAVQTGNLANGSAASGVSISVPYSGGNSGVQYGQTVTSTGVTGLTATLATSIIAASGNLTYTITGTPSAAGTASFAISVGGQSCTITATVGPTALPANITLTAITDYFVASVYDQDYTPYTTPTVAASLTTPVAADGVNEGSAIDIQGILTTTGVTITIPYTVTGSSVNLPAFSQTITVPAASTQDGISRDVTFSYPAATYAVGSGNITATLQAIGGTLNLKKLDIQSGVGNDAKGWLLAQFRYSTNSSGASASFAFRDIAGIPDKNFADANHRMLYLPVLGADGSTWLNNNLGADYSNTAKAVFNPGKQATSYTDQNAYGSQFQWGRFSDGHELINWTSSTAGTGVNGTTNTLSSTDNPGTSSFITPSVNPVDWRSPQNANLWQGVAGINNPCPTGYRVPTIAEFYAVGFTNIATAYSSALKFSGNNSRSYTGGASTGGNVSACFWPSNISANLSSIFYINAANLSTGGDVRGYGFAIRCIKDNTAAAAIGAINCGSAVQTGTLGNGTSASGVSIAVPYSGGNSGVQYGQTVTSTGVTGLTATLATSVISASGNLTYTISGTPSSAGSASFAISVGGQSCTLTATVLAAAPLPANITLNSINPYFVASVYDQNYLPYTAPTTAASLTTSVAADGTNEATTIDIQGTLTTTGVSISIPYTVTGSSVNLPAFSQTITIPAASTQDGISRDVTFSYNATTLAVGSGIITATLKAIGGTLNAKKLDVQTGVGNDALGVLLGQFTYATNNTSGTANFQFRDIAGIPDRNIADANHVMLYVPVSCADGNTWLNNNLGADYTNTAKAAFNPTQQATSAADFNAYGSLFQWGRYGDGHELINWASSTVGTAVNGTTGTLATADVPGNSLFIISTSAPNYWRNPQNNALWQGVIGTNNPCPIGYRLPTRAEVISLCIATNINDMPTAASSPLKFSGAGGRVNQTASFFAQGNAYIITSTIDAGTNAPTSTNITANVSGLNHGGNPTGFAFPVRCIKDNSTSATITAINCGSAVQTGTLGNGTAASGVTISVPYSGGNSGVQYGQTIASTGVTGLTATLAASTISTSGNFTYTISGTPTSAGTASFALSVGGQSCTLTATVAATAPLPANITLSAINPYFVASVNDNDYTPYSTPTATASFATAQAADGTNEATLIDIQGTLSTTGVSISIPYTVTGSSVTLPAFTQTITIPAASTQDGISRDVTFSYSAATLAVGSGNITATLKSVGGTLNAKKLDVQTGVGNDNLGVLLAQFTYATNNTTGTANFQFRDIAGIPDKNIANANHVMLYVPITGADGNIWLNNNLGADYSNTSKAAFNPAQQATSFDDFRAYGSLFQWGRYSDGHELINWTSASAATLGGTTNTLSTTDNPSNALFITNSTNWRNPANSNLWQGVVGTNNPCPVGYRLPTAAQLTTWATSAGVTNYTTAASSSLKLTAPGFRTTSGVGPLGQVADRGNYVSSTVAAAVSALSSGSNFSSIDNTWPFANGLSVRCIKDNTPAATIGAINCGSAIQTGTLGNGTEASGVSIAVPYSGGNSGVQYGQTVTSTGVTGLTATLAASTIAASGNFTYTITGTPTSAGTASFAISVGGQSCTLTATVAATAPLPANITLSAINPYFVASVYDQDYTPYTTPTAAASLTTPVAADGTNEATTIDIQGTLSTTGVSINIPYTVTGSSITLPAFTQTITIPAASTQDGISRDVTFSYSAATLAVGSGNITATLKAVGGTLNAKKLDVQTGVGNDNLGVLLAQFTYATNNTTGTANFQFRDIAGIPDRNIADANHRMLYLPVTGADGNVWLNNNLGADYSNTAKAAFNPAQQATSATDFRATGSLFQWGRYSDGHELINRVADNTSTAVNSSTTSTLSSTDTPGNSTFIAPTAQPANWRTSFNNALWQGEAGTNNPCPFGYRLPTQAELTTLKTAGSMTDAVTALSSTLKLVSAAGSREFDGTFYQTQTGYWSSTAASDVNGYNISMYYFASTSITTGFGYRSQAYNVRCIKGNTPAATIGAINCSSAVQTGTLGNGTAASGVSIAVPYSGGNSGVQYGQTIASTGVTGLTATLAASTISTSGNFTYTITGTPTSAGTAIFAVSVGGQSCILTATVGAAPANPIGTGSLSGKTCFDVAISNDNANGCGALSGRTSQKADFTQLATNTQTYTFTPSGTVSNVRFVYFNTNGTAITAISGGNSGNNISTAQTATVTYSNTLNTAATGLSASNAITSDVYVGLAEKVSNIKLSLSSIG